MELPVLAQISRVPLGAFFWAARAQVAERGGAAHRSLGLLGSLFARARRSSRRPRPSRDGCSEATSRRTTRLTENVMHVAHRAPMPKFLER
eukprot:3860893-Pyramimonas_sp.AAC.1